MIEPKEGEIWINTDNQCCYIVKIFENKNTGGKPYKTYKIIEYTMKEGYNFMECNREHLTDKVGESGVPNLSAIFQVKLGSK